MLVIWKSVSRAIRDAFLHLTILLRSLFDPSAVTAQNSVFDKPNADKLACMLRRENVVAKIPMENAK